MDLKSLLKAKLNNKTIQKSTLPKSQEIEDVHFRECLKNWNTKTTDSKEIPRFYWKLPKENEILQQQFREETRTCFLKRRNRQLLDNCELTVIWALLDQHKTGPEENLITYNNYKKVAYIAGGKPQHYFTANVFARLQQGDPDGRISIRTLFNYIMRKVMLQQIRIGLALHDSAGKGYLQEADLENYIYNEMPTLVQLDGLQSSFHEFYICTAIRKFFYFLDRFRTGRIKILDMLVYPILEELLSLRDEQLSVELIESNWFSTPYYIRVYEEYLRLDQDHNGMLTPAELADYGSGTLTKAFLDRIFQTCLTCKGEIDYKTYLDLVLTLEYRSEPLAMAYLFRILDINGQGYLDAATLKYFFRDIQIQLLTSGNLPVSFEDIKNEIFDMAQSKDPERITLDDLLRCGQGETVLSILIEFDRFLKYENREMLTTEPIED